MNNQKICAKGRKNELKYRKNTKILGLLAISRAFLIVLFVLLWTHLLAMWHGKNITLILGS